MQFSEKKEFLTQEDVNSIKKRTKIITIALVVFILIVIFMFSFIISATGDSIAIIFGGVFILFPIGALFYVHYAVKKDLQDGQKRVLKGIIQEKYQRTSKSSKSSSTSYFLLLGGQEIPVDKIQYDSVKDNQPVEIQMTLYSKTVIKLVPIQENIIPAIDDKTEVLDDDIYSEKTEVKAVPFTNSEKTQTMTFDDISILNEKKKSRIIWSIVLGVFVSLFVYGFLSVFLFIFIMQSDSDSEFSFLKWYDIVRWSAVALIFFLIFKMRVLPVITDVNAGNKIILERRIDDKIFSNVRLLGKNLMVTSSRGGYYYFVVESKYYNVSDQIYNSAEGGDIIYIHLSAITKTVLKIERKLR